MNFKFLINIAHIMILYSNTCLATSIINTHEKAKTFSMKLSEGCPNLPGNPCKAPPSPTIDNGIIYANAFDQYIYAIDQKTGEIIKRYNTNSYLTWGHSTPVIHDGFLYTTTGDLYAFDQKTEALKWVSNEQIYTTPVIYHGSLIVGAKYGVIAFDRWTGKIKWKFKSTYPEDDSFSSPLYHNGHIFVGSFKTLHTDGETGLYSFNAETGEREWMFRVGQYKTTPCAIDNTIFIGSGHYFYAFEPDAKIEKQMKWYYMDSTYPASLYTKFDTSPYCDSSKVYVSSNNSWTPPKFYAFDSNSGRVIWTFVPEHDSDISDSFEILSDPTVSNDAVFFGCDNYYLYALNKNTGTLKWKFKADAEIRSKPTISNGVVYFTTLAGTLYAIDEISGRMYHDTK